MRLVSSYVLSLAAAFGACHPAAAFAACSAANGNPAVAETTPDEDFIVDAMNGTVTHLKTGLMWKQCVQGRTGQACSIPVADEQSTYDWGGALAAANGANSKSFGGYTDWRLPNKKELESIAELCGYQPAINQNAFPGTPPDNFFWSSTSYVGDPAEAWMVTSGNGASGYSVKSSLHYVRLVRGTEGLDRFDLLKAARRVIGYP